MATKKTPYQYATKDIDSGINSKVENILDSDAFQWARDDEAKVKTEFSKTLLTWAMQQVNPNMDTYMENKITKGGHAEGRSIAGDDSDDGSDEESYFTRPNGQKYYHRQWGPTGTFNDVQVLRMAKDAMQFPLLYGPPGTGKTAMIEAAFGEDLITILGTGDTELADLVGGYIQDEEGQFVWVDGPLLEAAEQGRPLLIDEIGIIDPKVLTVVYGLMDGRREYKVTANPARGTVKAIDGFFVVGATNPNAPGVRLSEALLSRFTLQVEVTTDYARALSLGVDKHIVAGAKSLDQRARDGQLSWAPQFRELIAYRDVAAIFGTDFAAENLIASAPEDVRDEVIGTLSKGANSKVYNSAQIR